MSRVKSSRLSRASHSSATCNSRTRRTLHRRRSCRSASSMASGLLDPWFRPLPGLGSRPGTHAPPPHSSSRDHAPTSGHRPKAGPSSSLGSTSAATSAPKARSPLHQSSHLSHSPQVPPSPHPHPRALRPRPFATPQDVLASSRPLALHASPAPSHASHKTRSSLPHRPALRPYGVPSLRPVARPLLCFCLCPRLQDPPPSCYSNSLLVPHSGLTPPLSLQRSLLTPLPRPALARL